MSDQTQSKAFDIFKIILDKGLLAVVVVLAGFSLNKALENYKAHESWSSEVAKQRMTTGRDLVEAATALRGEHYKAKADAAAAKYDPAVVKAARSAEAAKAVRLDATIQEAKLLFPPEAYAGFAKYYAQVYEDKLEAPPASQKAEPFDFSFPASADATLENATSALAHYIATHVVIDRKTVDTVY